jgi:hypothetical protein
MLFYGVLSVLLFFHISFFICSGDKRLSFWYSVQNERVSFVTDAVLMEV